MRYRWNILPDPPEEELREISRTAGIPRVLARVLYHRGYSSPGEVESFLAPDLTGGHDPSLLTDLPAAARRLRRAVAGEESIRIHGDYDVDGVTATALLVRVARSMGGRVDARIPHRNVEGYGLSMEAVEEAASDGVDLLVTVDCGITAIEEAGRARELGLDLIITDHHTPTERLPHALAVINPRRPGDAYPFKDLAGVGVAYKLALALDAPCPEPCLMDYLDLVALGTTADVVPLRGENRMLVKYGLIQAAQTCWPGLDALMDRVGLKRDGLSAGHLVFNVAPRINAAGRMAHAEAALEMFLTDDPFRASQLARELDEQNDLRREADEQTLNLALELIRDQGGVADRRALVLCAEDWHPGVIGIVASRLAERYNRPTVLVSFEGELGRGSARGIDGFDLYDALASCAEHLEAFGGHRHAAGLTLSRAKQHEFVASFEEVAASRLSDREIRPELEVDAEVRLEELTPEVLEVLKRFEPFGNKNRRPLFLARDVQLRGSARRVGSDRSHLRFSVRRDGEPPLDVIGFGLGDRASELEQGEADLVFAFEENEFRGVRRPQLRLKDLRVQAP
ncbi:MAG: single-stranded-DNA-specific exonuclease RecJ [bacterium]